MALTPVGKNAFIALITQADDEGRVKTTAAHLDAICLRTGATDEVQAAFDQMDDQEMIVQYRVGRNAYVWLVNWSKHQKVQHPTPSDYPAPDDPNALRIRDAPGALMNPREASGTDMTSRDKSGALMTSRARADRIGPDQDRKGPEPPLPPHGGAGDVSKELAQVVRLPSDRMAEEYREWIAELNQATGRSFRGDSKSLKGYRVLRKEYSRDDLAALARGVGLSRFHRGENDRGVPYQDPITVLRSKQLQTLIDLGRGAIRAAPMPEAEDWTALSPRAQRYGDAAR